MIHDPPARSDNDEWDRAFNDALRSIASMPDPAEAAMWLPETCIVGLIAAYDSRGAPRHATETFGIANEMRQAGLIEVNGPHLTAFGNAVRRVIMERDR